MARIRHGIGIFMKMACMRIFSRLPLIHYGGIGAGIGAFQVQDGDLAGDGLLHGITAAGILRGIPLGIRLIGMMVTGVATGDQDGIITIIRTGPEIIVQDIPTIVRQDTRGILLPDAALLE